MSGTVSTSGRLDGEWKRLAGKQRHGAVPTGENLVSPNEVTASLWGHKSALAARKSFRFQKTPNISILISNLWRSNTDDSILCRLSCKHKLNTYYSYSFERLVKLA